MLDRIVELMPDVAIPVRLAPPVPLLVAHQALLVALPAAREPPLKVVVRALPRARLRKVEEDQRVRAPPALVLARELAHEHKFLRGGVRHGS